MTRAVNGHYLSPTALEQLVLNDENGKRITNLKISENCEGVILHGKCGDFYTKQMAQHIIMKHTKVSENKIKVIK